MTPPRSDSGPSVHAKSVLVLALVLAGCTRVPFNVPPPPPVPTALPAPAPPELRSEATDFEASAEAEAVGRDRLRLKSEVVGLAPITGDALLADLHDELLVALLAGGFRQLVDLEPSREVTASHSRSARGEQVALQGQMDDLMTLVPVSRARVVITGDVVESGSQQRQLPVRFWYDDAELAVYAGQVEAWAEARAQRLAEVESARSSYVEVFRQAEVEYDEARPWWQRLVDGVVEIREAKDRDAYLDALQRVAASLRREPPSAADLSTEAAGRQEAQAVTIYAARLRLQVQQPDSGEVLAILHVHADGRTPAELVDNLVSAAQTALGAR